ncbi:MAG: glycosyltransferase family 4 protein [Rhodospirillales bacterium]
MSEPIRILLVCHGHPELVTGGTELFAHGLFRALAGNERVQPLFLACVSGLHRADRGLSSLQGIGSAVRDEILIRTGRFDRLMLAPIEAGPFVEAFAATLRWFRPHVVHFHHFSLVGLDALVIARRLLPEARIVATLHDYQLICTNDGLMVTADTRELCSAASCDACHRCFPAIAASRFAARDAHFRSLLGLVDRFLAPSEIIREKFVAWGLPAERIERMANAVPASLRAQSSGNDASGSRARFACFGNVAPHKGSLVVVKAARRLAKDALPIRLHIHGRMQFQPAAFAQAFTEEVDRAGDAVLWHGGYRGEDVGRLLHATDWIVVPSVWWENAPLVILEAFAAGRPVICSDVGGMAELVQDGVNGLHFRMGDDADLARVMRRAATEDGLWQRLCAGLPHVPDMEMAARRHLALYQSLSVERALCA